MRSSPILTCSTQTVFFSGAFRKRLACEVSTCSGGFGLPGIVAQHVSVNIIKMLFTKLPAVVTTHCTAVMKACMEKVKNVVNQRITYKIHPKLHKILNSNNLSIIRNTIYNFCFGHLHNFILLVFFS